MRRTTNNSNNNDDENDKNKIVIVIVIIREIIASIETCGKFYSNLDFCKVGVFIFEIN